jgi:hypothetical protein
MTARQREDWDDRPGGSAAAPASSDDDRRWLADQPADGDGARPQIKVGRARLAKVRTARGASRRRT